MTYLDIFQLKKFQSRWNQYSALLVSCLALAEGSAHAQSAAEAALPPENDLSEMAAPSFTSMNDSVQEALSLRAVIAMALRNNSEITSADLGRVIEQERIKSALLAFDLKLDAAYLYQSIKSPQNAQDYVKTGGGTASPFNPAQPILTEPNIFIQRNHVADFGLSKKFTTGTILEFGSTMRVLDNTLNRRMPPAIFNPEWETYTGLTLTQPLLRDYGIAANTAGVRIARANAKRADLEWQSMTSQVVAEAMKRYYDVVFTLANLKVQQESIALAQKLTDDTRARSNEGLAASNEVLVAEAGVYRRMEDALAAEMQYIERQNALQLLFKTPEEVIAQSSRIMPVDGMRTSVPVPDRNAMVQTALNRRHEIRQADEFIAIRSAELDHAKSQARPRLDLVASYGVNGLASDGGSSYREAYERQGPEWTAGVQFSTPLNRDNLHAQRRIATSERVRALANRNSVRLRVALEVDTVISRLRADRQRLEATRKSREAAAESATGGLTRFNEGVLTSFEVLQLQREFSEARSREYAAMADLNKDLVDLQLATGTLMEKQGFSVVTETLQSAEGTGEVEIVRLPELVEPSEPIKRSVFSRSKGY